MAIFRRKQQEGALPGEAPQAQEAGRMGPGEVQAGAVGPARMGPAQAAAAPGEGAGFRQAQAPGGIGRHGPVGKERVREAEETLKAYKAGKANLEQRIIENEQWYKLRHWERIRAKKANPGDPEPASAWLLNCIANKHADAMDNYPAPSVLPREQGDEADAELLSAILPVVLEQNGFEQTYSDMWWYKLKSGTGVTGVFWNPMKNNGLGDIDIRALDLLNLFWEPGITDIQKSRHLFHVDLVDRDLLGSQYPFLGGAAAPTIDVAKYVYDDTVDTSKKAAVVDWYYKARAGGREVLHYCKFCNGEVLYASENDPAYAERGFYDHGKYPVVFDTLFPEAGTPAGFGYIDICKGPQLYIDKLDQAILKHAVMGARPRFFVRGDGAVNEGEYADWAKDFVHYQGSGDPRENVIPIEIPSLPEAYVTVRNLKVDELKETSGNRDFSQGGTSSGVTAASAIAALQEAGSKLSRDMIKASYRAFAKTNYLCIELMRQFYQEGRFFRVVGKQGEMKFMAFNARRIAQKPQGDDFGLDLGYRVPIFDIKVTSQKSSPFSTVAQNERAKELYGMGFFRPDLADQALGALEMMDFEGIEAVRERISQNGTLYERVQQMTQLAFAMAMELDAYKGSNYAAQVAQITGIEQAQTPQASNSTELRTNVLGDAFNRPQNSTAGAARTRAASASTPG